jgi:hypothetical protein
MLTALLVLASFPVIFIGLGMIAHHPRICTHDDVWPVRAGEDEYAFVCCYCKSVERKQNGKWVWIRRKG